MSTEVKAMEVKKTQPLTKPVNTSAKEASIKTWEWKDFLSDIKAEFAKINWTSPEELRTYTKIVVAGTFIFGLGIYAMDLLIQFVLNSLNFVLRLIGV